MEPPETRELEILQEISTDRLMADTTRIAAQDRLSGSPGEALAVDYFREVMTGLGFEVEILRTEGLISLPRSASLTVLSPERGELPCLTHSFAASTPPEGLEAELVYLSGGDEAPVEGRIVMRDGLAAPAPTWEMEQRGALGQIWVNAGDLPHNMCLSTVWGQPTPETAHRLLRTPVASLARPAGDRLKSLLAAGPVRIRLKTEVWTGFADLPLALAQLRGRAEPDKYVLVNGHVDSWHRGAYDNATGNACMLELARLASGHRAELRRGLRVAWWSGHSHGRYAGSTWYADHYWADLERNAIVHFNVDCPGGRGATEYPIVECSAECFALGRGAVEACTGHSPQYKRIGRSGDNSFWGIGLPTLFQLPSRPPQEQVKRDTLIPGLTWFWHTEADTIDQVDPAVLTKDARIYLTALWRLCTAPVLPLDFRATAEEFSILLKELQSKAGSAFDLSPALDQAGRFRARAAELERAGRAVAARFSGPGRPGEELERAARRLDDCLMKLSRILIPVGYSAADRFGMDLAVPIPPLPRLQPAAGLAGLERTSRDFKFLERQMVRERNRVEQALARAAELIEATLTQLET